MFWETIVILHSFKQSLIYTLIKSIKIIVKGLVQGVGFRPFVYRIAHKYNLKGNVENRNDGVLINIEGEPELINLFLLSLKNEAPVASSIESIAVQDNVIRNFQIFEIVKSNNMSDTITEISPDIAVCDDCLTDLKSQNHRINYPFINCTNCGPRFTIIQDIPYDRDKTTMKDFVMCDTCNEEYTDVNDRRFHAQPVACNNCGPVYELLYNGNTIRNFKELIQTTASIIDKGHVIAMKGLGGFHIACNALDRNAVIRLRKYKNREHKPLAVMARNINVLNRVVVVSESEKKSLLSWRKPIVLLKLINGNIIPNEISNGLNTLGVMLPYLPFHYLLFEELKTDMIVLTSGNISDEPIIIENEIAKKSLSNISDALVINNRDIYNRTDDSVVFMGNNKERIIRRSRGYVPNPVNLPLNLEGIFAAGAELKNCFCIGKENQAILSQHIGDLKNLETYDFYKETVNQFFKLFRMNHSLSVGDMHPDYLSTQFIKKMNMPSVFVQHHHAHIASCMAEHNLDEQVIGISFDGTGYGDDGNIWGGEFFIADYQNYKRISHFEYIPIPGGDSVSKEPWRMAVSYLYKVYGKEFLNFQLPFLKNSPIEKINLIIQAIDKKLNCPLTSSVGRLFDAVSAISNICVINSFEAEAPMRLEAAIAENCSDKYPYLISNVVCFDEVVKGIVSDLKNSTKASVISAKFHNTIISVILDIAVYANANYNINKVVLSGGVFQNKYLLENSERILIKNKFEVYTHCKVPSNDGGIALGQLAIAAKRRSMNKQIIN